MEIQGWVALSFVLGATVAVIIALVVRMRANRRWRATLDERQNAAEVERKALTAEAERAHAELRQQKQELQEDAEARLEHLALQHEAAFQDRRMLVDFLKDRARRSIETELVSREAILRASATLGLNGVLATRTFILVQEGMSTNRHVIQLDHVLLTDAGALLVDHRTWDGIIFDGVRPSEAQPAFGNLVDDVALRPPFALQITSGASATAGFTAPGGGAPEGSLRVLTHLGPSAPRSQALAHATHLARFSEQTLGESIAVDTCVFYSNATATVYTDAATLTPSADRTAVVADEAQFLDLLARRERARRRPLEVEQIERLTALLHEQGAKIDAFGDYSRLMPAGEPLDEAGADAHAGTGAGADTGASASADAGAEALVPAGSVSG
ncbi:MULTISPECIES: hypothetical protein [unclassified Pseudoclavibacter]|uniref:hypothetical protein n=1 Tax=unclassified Pseudoclavibacter TaxID=2615177 RepID=UPI0012F410AC|nr:MULTISPECIES: hypothetical protein [unclassified Pseudoclavibacter]MBF4459992.1 hypothetical protein [Pseudoclavibacter sp. VKM Ac-2867]VXB09433.1 conserved hypothetical protein [Pseudoclavibacter sp. 8L]